MKQSKVFLELSKINGNIHSKVALAFDNKLVSDSDTSSRSRSQLCIPNTFLWWFSNETGRKMAQKNDLMEERVAADDVVSLTIPKELHRRFEKRLHKEEFPTVNRYISYVLEEVLNELEDVEVHGEQANSDSLFSKEDQENVEERLRSLGYM